MLLIYASLRFTLIFPTYTNFIKFSKKQQIQGGSNMTETDLCVNKPHKYRSYSNHLVHLYDVLTIWRPNGNIFKFRILSYPHTLVCSLQMFNMRQMIMIIIMTMMMMTTTMIRRRRRRGGRRRRRRGRGRGRRRRRRRRRRKRRKYNSGSSRPSN